MYNVYSLGSEYVKAPVNSCLVCVLIPQMLIKKELASSELVIATNKTLTGVRSYYLVHSSQENSMLIEKFVDWIQLELKNEALPCSFGTIE